MTKFSQPLPIIVTRFGKAALFAHNIKAQISSAFDRYINALMVATNVLLPIAYY